ncbi:MAG: M42 family metallopeptidase [Chloroflexi bacterium]|nr:M42 family metallopeptidase [Chloroflexota bacterium]MBI3341455.1 M42 family metallopeptidase [Chloroflexota bacterium]
MKSLIEKLTGTFSPSGYEDAIRAVIRKEITKLADEVRVDALGNLIARKGKGGKKIMIAAHMDEIGLMVTHVDNNGFVRFTGIGGVYPRNLPGGRVRFVNGTAGVIGLEPADHASDVPALDKMFIDVGAADKKNCPVRIGDVAAFERPFADLGNRLVAKSMDDRIGCAVAIEALRALKSTPHEVYFVFTTQEEVGTRGAQTSAFGIDPDLGFSIDVTGWGDTPGQKDFEVGLGKGPAIKIRDGGMLSDPRIVEWMIRTAEKAKLPYQREVLLGGTTDARAMQLVRGGVPVGCVSIPCRYVHTPSEMVDYNDVKNAVKLIVALLRAPINLGA